MTSTIRQAQKDAREFALAKMFYGEGAGTRRKFIRMAVEQKIAEVPGYREAFQKELLKQDFAKISRTVRRERKMRDAATYAGRNTRALVRGDSRNVSVSLALVGLGAYFIHDQGYDKKVLEATKRGAVKVTDWAVEKFPSRHTKKAASVNFPETETQEGHATVHPHPSAPTQQPAMHWPLRRHS